MLLYTDKATLSRALPGKIPLFSGEPAGRRQHRAAFAFKPRVHATVSAACSFPASVTHAAPIGSKPNEDKNRPLLRPHTIFVRRAGEAMLIASVTHAAPIGSKPNEGKNRPLLRPHAIFVRRAGEAMLIASVTHAVPYFVTERSLIA